MGDKSPKATQKKSQQKVVQNAAVTAKKNAAVAAKKAPGKSGK